VPRDFPGDVEPGEETPMRAGLYAWVSTAEESTLSLQHDALRAYVAERGWTAVCQIEDLGSEAAEHPQRAGLMKRARDRELDVVLVWCLDRWCCSMADLVLTLQELNALDVGFVSLSEPLDLTTPSGRAMAEMLGVFAEFERKIRRERVKAGISRARQQGRPHGRPPTAARQAEEVRRLASQQMSRSEIARRLGIGRTSVRRILSGKD
jgi:putative DNA-invertase from lambdoid prophage Rac